jgi:hypothetical protein
MDGAALAPILLELLVGVVRPAHPEKEKTPKKATSRRSAFFWFHGE